MSRISRRAFARTVGAVAGAALLPTRRALGDDQARPAPPPAPPAPAATAAAGAAHKLSPAAQAEADARVQIIVARYGARLSPADRTDLARMSADAQELLEKVRAYP